MSENSITRRDAIGGAALGVGAAALGATQALAQPKTRKTFVLIHGGYHGGWCWKKVRTSWRRSGHKVYAPSLTGLADRSHLFSKDTTLDAHIMDIVDLFKWEEMANGCLVVPSAGGWPCSGALEQIGDRVSSDRLARRVHAEERRERARPRSRPRERRWTKRWPRAGSRRNPPKCKRILDPAEGLRLDQLQADGATERDPVHNTIKLTGALQKVAKKTYIRAPKYRQGMPASTRRWRRLQRAI